MCKQHRCAKYWRYLSYKILLFNKTLIIVYYIILINLLLILPCFICMLCIVLLCSFIQHFNCKWDKQSYLGYIKGLHWWWQKSAYSFLCDVLILKGHPDAIWNIVGLEWRSNIWKILDVVIKRMWFWNSVSI